MHAARCYKTKTKWFCINVTAIVHVDGVVVIVVVVYVSTSRFIPLTSWVIVHLACCCPCLCINSSSNSSELLIVLSRLIVEQQPWHMQRAVWDISLGLCAYQKSASLGCVVIVSAVTDLSGNRRLEDRWLQVWKVTSLSTGQWLLLIATAVQPSTCVCVCVCVCALIGSLWTLRTRCLWLNADFTTNNIRPSTSVWYVCVCAHVVFLSPNCHTCSVCL